MRGRDPNSSLSLSDPMGIHIVGIGGAGMRSIALVLAKMGHTISGSDLKHSPGLERLESEGITVTIGHSRDNLPKVSLLTKSTAVPDTNVEVHEAKQRGITVVSRSTITAAITREKNTVSVAGTHGKTTTSSMLSLLLAEGGVNPSFLIGGEVNEIGCGALWDSSSQYLVVEADESDGTFLELETDIAIVTSVEPDHLAYYGGAKQLKQAFKQFVENAKQRSYVCADQVGTEHLLQGENIVTYGENPNSDYVIHGYSGGKFSSSFSISGPKGEIGVFKLASPGLHNALNATAAIAVAADMGMNGKSLRRGIAHFAGVARRFQFRGEQDNISFIDDYAHLPTEVKAALAAAKDGEWKRIVAVFQPHRYTRTYELANDFVGAFDDADEVIITGVYPSGEKPIPGVTGKLIADSLERNQKQKTIHYYEHRSELIDFLKRNLRSGDLCITLGAGDLTSLPNELMGDS